MSTGPEYAKLAANALRREEIEDAPELRGSPPAFNAEPRARTARIDAVRQAIRQRARRRKLRAIGAGAAFFAAAAAIVLVVRGHRAGVEAVADGANDTVTLERDGARETFAQGKKIQPGDHVVVNEGGHAALALTTGTRIALGSAADLSVLSQSQNQIYWLAKGELEAHVAKLRDGDRFIVRTPDAEVEVRGTQFHVTMAKPDPACGNASATRVNVTEGVVTVRHAGVENRVAAGEEWPPCPRAAAAAVPARAEGPSPALEPPKAALSSGTSKRAPAAPPAAGANAKPASEPTSELSAQNELYGRAADQKKTGDVRAAIAMFDLYLARYPKSALAESATVERWRLLARTDRATARAAAKDYLNRYANGFARAEARALLDE